MPVTFNWLNLKSVCLKKGSLVISTQNAVCKGSPPTTQNGLYPQLSARCHVCGFACCSTDNFRCCLSSPASKSGLIFGICGKPFYCSWAAVWESLIEFVGGIPPTQQCSLVHYVKWDVAWHLPCHETSWFAAGVRPRTGNGWRLKM